jgi:hypothetical protein
MGTRKRRRRRALPTKCSELTRSISRIIIIIGMTVVPKVEKFNSFQGFLVTISYGRHSQIKFRHF